jgi:nucleotide-binding universal stress UspA family protein
MKLLLAVDGSSFSDAAVEEVGTRPWPPNSEVIVITAAELPMIVGLEPWAAAPIYFEEMEGAVRDSAKAALEKAVSKLKSMKTALAITSEVIQGPPREVIVDEAEKRGVDLIVMGSRGLGAWSRLLLGSVSNAVVHHAKCSVEVVRRRNQ